MPSQAKIARSLLPYALKKVFQGNNNYLILIDPANGEITEAQSKAEWIARESTSPGYSRVQFGWTENQYGSFDPIDQRHETDQIEINFTAASAILQYSQIAAILNASPDAPKSLLNTSINVATNKITLENHGLINGEEFVLIPEGTTLPTPLTENNIFYAMQVTSDSFAISTDGINIVDLSGVGSGGRIWLKKAKGEKAFVITERTSTGVLSLVTLQPNQTQAYTMFLAAQDNNG